MNGFHKRLQAWYALHGRRDLPWRNTTDPYAIYLSEIMLQQTQVKTVLERFYFPFLKRFPTLAALANAPQDEVLAAWHGLGYYNRALNLHKAAKMCVPPPAGGRLGGGHYGERCFLLRPPPGLPPVGGGVVESLLSLPGIGRNTAHAIAAFAYHQPVAVMEANVKRVLCRIFALKNPKEPELWEKAHELLDSKNPFDYNQAMMDIGAMVCTKRAPRCGECPASAICEGKDSPESYPAAKVKKTTPVRHKKIAVFQNPKGQYYASPRSSRFLHGLYHFVETDAESAQVELLKKHYSFGKAAPIGHVRQQYSHFTLEAEVFLIPAGQGSGTHWHSRAMLGKLPVSMVEKKIIKLIKP